MKKTMLPLVILSCFLFQCDISPSDSPQPEEGMICDLRADVNRDGVIDLVSTADDANEELWTASSGAVFMANMDDDQGAYPMSGTDAQLAAARDAADAVVNGNEDLPDLAPIMVRAWAEAPDGVQADLSVDSPADTNIRVFKYSGSSFIDFPAPMNFTAEEIRHGVELAIEAKDFVRDDTVWNGFANFTLTMTADGETKTDTVRFRVAPLIFPYPLVLADQAYVTNIPIGASVDFRTDLSAACTAAGLASAPLEFTGLNDQWTGDFFTQAYMAMPVPGGNHVMRVNLRSSNYTTGALRSSGRIVFTVLRGADSAGAVQYDPAHADADDSLNSFGNLMVIPPFTHNGKSWPLGRILRGSKGNSAYPDASFDRMVRAQGLDSTNTAGMQDIVYIDVEAFLNVHINEIVNFVPDAAATHGWRMLAADPQLAVTLLTDKMNDGFGAEMMFVGKQWSGSTPAQISIIGVLTDPDLITYNAWAASEINDIVTVLKNVTGITDADILRVPVLFQGTGGLLFSYTPNLVRGRLLTPTAYIASDPHGPVINGTDMFMDHFSAGCASLGITVYFLEDWDLYHSLNGNTANGTQLRTNLSSVTAWWSSGL